MAVFLLAAMLALSAPPAAQQPSADASLAAGIGELRDGDFLRALFSLNEAVSLLANRPEAAALLARAHAYRAAAYIRLDQPEKAMAAALLALRADPKIVVTTPDFPAAVVKLFADPAAFAVVRPAELPKPAHTPAAADRAPLAPAVIAPATIFIYWPSQFGANKKPKVLCDGVHVADLKNGRYIALRAAPGAHEITFDGQKIPVRIDTGEDQYFRGFLSKMSLSVHVTIAMTPAADAKAEMSKEMTVNDPDRTFGTECNAPPLQKRSGN